MKALDAYMLAILPRLILPSDGGDDGVPTVDDEKTVKRAVTLAQLAIREVCATAGHDMDVPGHRGQCQRCGFTNFVDPLASEQ